MIDNGIAEDVKSFAYGNIENKINVDITITEPFGNEQSYAVVWENQKRILRRAKRAGAGALA